MPSDVGYVGDADINTGQTDHGAIKFLVRQMIGRSAHVALVSVVSVTNAGTVDPVGFVDVQPLVNMQDGQNRPTKHGVIHNLPYFRIQGGTNAIIIDPVAGDIGVALFCDRDISSVKANKAQSNPGSRRRYDMADGLYVGGFLSAAPTNYVQFNTAGITIVSTSAVTVNATGDVVLNAASVTTNCDVVIDGKSFVSHTHSGVTTGSGDTGAPV